MSIPTALAPSVGLATPRAKKALEQTLETFFVQAELLTFYQCHPPTHQVEDQQRQRWKEANWGAEVETDLFFTADLPELQRLLMPITINNVKISTHHPGKLYLTFWLSARVEQ